jgi:hypothetical protein
MFHFQLMNYERSLYGYTSVSFVNTSLGSVPDIYLTMPTSRSRRQATVSPPAVVSSTPMQPMSANPGRRISSTVSQRSPSSILSSTIVDSSPARSSFLYPSTTLPRQTNPYVNRSVTSALPARSSAIISTYNNAYSPNVAPTGTHHRPVSSSFTHSHMNPSMTVNGSTHKSVQRQPVDIARTSSTSTGRPLENLTSELYNSPKTHSFSTVKYIPSSYNRYNRP